MKHLVGQVLWYVPEDTPWEKPRFVEITKVGRKWLELNEPGLRACRLTLMCDRRNSPHKQGRCWLTKADYERHLKRHSAWRHLRRQVQDKWTAPDSVTLEQIQAASDLLRLSAFA
jgi:hypothetical protein